MLWRIGNFGKSFNGVPGLLSYRRIWKKRCWSIFRKFQRKSREFRIRLRFRRIIRSDMKGRIRNIIFYTLGICRNWKASGIYCRSQSVLWHNIPIGSLILPGKANSRNSWKVNLVLLAEESGFTDGRIPISGKDCIANATFLYYPVTWKECRWGFWKQWATGCRLFPQWWGESRTLSAVSTTQVF